MEPEPEVKSPSMNGNDSKHTISPTERIKELNTIDQEISKVLRSASLAIRTLTATPTVPKSLVDGAEMKSPLVKRKELFESHTNEFYTLVQSISAHLRRQTYALEEASIISPEATSSVEMQGASQAPKQAQRAENRPSAAMTGSLQTKSDVPMHIINGGLGNLDVGWLNSRRDVVGKQKEAELWREAKMLLEKMDNEANADKMETT